MEGKTKYHVVAKDLREKIITGIYQPGDRLPSEKDLATKHGVSRQTVRQAISILLLEGLVEKRQGSRTRIKEKRISMANHRKGSKAIPVITTYIGEYIFPDILRAVEEILTSNHYHPMVFATKNRVDNERHILQNMLEQPLAGMIIEGTKTALPNPNIDLYKEFKRRGIPIVFIHSTYPELTSAVSVTAADKSGGVIATEYLISKGHERIAGIFKSDDIQGHLRYAGYTEALRSNNLPIIDDNVLWYTTESKEFITVLGLQILKDCTAVVCYNDEVAIQLMTLCKANGINIPDDISIMSFDNSIYSELATPKISSCSQHKRKIGVLAAQKIINLVNGIKEESSVLPWRVIEKESVKEIDKEQTNTI